MIYGILKISYISKQFFLCLKLREICVFVCVWRGGGQHIKKITCQSNMHHDILDKIMIALQAQIQEFLKINK